LHQFKSTEEKQDFQRPLLPIRNVALSRKVVNHARFLGRLSALSFAGVNALMRDG